MTDAHAYGSADSFNISCTRSRTASLTAFSTVSFTSFLFKPALPFFETTSRTASLTMGFSGESFSTMSFSFFLSTCGRVLDGLNGVFRDPVRLEGVHHTAHDFRIAHDHADLAP